MNYLDTNYNERLRPMTAYPRLFCKHLADRYFGSRKGRLLDVCCGRGDHLQIFEDLGFDAYGVDRELEATKRGHNVAVLDVDKMDLPHDEGFFDFVMVKSAIEHIRDVDRLMEGIKRVLKPGGAVVITTCDWKTCYKIFYDDPQHRSPFTIWSLQNLLESYGFVNVKVEDFYHLPFTWAAPWRRLIPKVVALLPIDFPQNVPLTDPITKIIKFSREKQILGYARKLC